MCKFVQQTLNQIRQAPLPGLKQIFCIFPYPLLCTAPFPLKCYRPLGLFNIETSNFVECDAISEFVRYTGQTLTLV